jgi:single-stranded DNA-binding protein
MQKIIITGKLAEDPTTKRVDRSKSLLISFDVIASRNFGTINEPRKHYSCELELLLTLPNKEEEASIFSQRLKKGTNIIVEGYPEAVIIKGETGHPQAIIQIQVFYCELSY